MKKSEIRKDYLFDSYVIMAPGRSRRPRSFVEREAVPATDSPFTSDKISADRILDAVGRGEQRAVSIPNIFPAVSTDSPKAYGAHEVIIETPSPNVPLCDLPLANFENIFKLYARRTKALMQDKKINYILCLKNEGVKSGASIPHAHSQVMALALLPPRLAEEARLAAEYRTIHGREFYADLIAREMASPRAVYEDGYFAAFTPYASVYHHELWFFSKRPVDNISRLTSAEISSLAAMVKKALSRIDTLGLSYNFFCHQAVSNRRQHFCLKLQPRGSVWGGFELGSGVVVNSVLPEESAKHYRAS